LKINTLSRYLESMPSICENVTVIFTSLVDAESYLARYHPMALSEPSFRSIEICVQASPVIASLYTDKTVQEQEGRSHPIYVGCFTMTDSPWSRICAHLATYQSLNDLRIWFNLDATDLKSWDERVVEAAMFADLLKVRTKIKERFVLELPEIVVGRGWLGTIPRETGQGSRLQGRMLEEAPFTVVRGPRPNMKRVHMVGLSSLFPQG
jgi:hypothetical protein